LQTFVVVETEVGVQSDFQVWVRSTVHETGVLVFDGAPQPFDERGLHHDYEVWLEELAPHAPIEQYWHNRTDEDACPERTGRAADAHLKRQIMGREVVAAVTGGRLDFGTWERIF
jgi:thiamine phosphate synthase YjbQ (UPF0047 family)